MSRDLPTQSCSQCPVRAKSLFAELSPAELKDIDQNKTTTQYDKGDTFSRQGGPVEDVYCLSQGAAKVVMSIPQQNKESIVRIATPGEMLGYRCIFSEKTYRATAFAIDESVACKISKRKIFELIGDNPGFAMKMLNWFGRDVAAAENHHNSFCLKNTRERVAEALHILALKCGQERERGVLIPIRMMRADWAGWIGIAKENLIRCFSDFKKEGLIDQEGDYVLVLDVHRVSAVAALESRPDDIYHLHQ